MENKRIRQITEAIHGREPFVYTVGQERNLPINGKYEKRTIFQIEEIENHYRIHIGHDEVSQQWNDIAKSDRVNIQYFIE
jgi:phenylacetate-coenzyme A ligase PaaK-like adenylate-forming protein